MAVVFGFLVGALTLSAMQIHVIERVGAVLAEMSYAQAYGRNVVNVILVDFRALDTFGEIIVLAIAAAKLWNRNVLASDIDEDSVRIAAENAALNGAGVAGVAGSWE